jgi:hypothetical protein
VLAVTVSDKDRCSVVHARGKLDLAGRAEFVWACVEADRAAVVIDMAQPTFQD